MSVSTGSLPRRWQDKTNLALGVLVALSPWLLGHAGNAAAAWNAWAVGALVIVGTGALLARMPPGIAWAVSFASVWMFLSPRILGFTDATLVTAAQMVLGAVIAFLAAWSVISAANTRNAAAVL